MCHANDENFKMIQLHFKGADVDGTFFTVSTMILNAVTLYNRRLVKAMINVDHSIC